VILSLVIVAFVVPALAGPLAYCLEGDDGSRVVAVTDAAGRIEAAQASSTER
jgi:hypothetical protein